jgi:hypothetical protein
MIGWEEYTIVFMEGLLADKCLSVSQKKQSRESLVAAGNPKPSLVLY